MSIDCHRFYGYMREVCEGRTKHTPRERAKLVARWSRPDYGKPRPRGLGDAVAGFLHRVSFGLVQPTGCGGCNQRREALNRFGRLLKRLTGRAS